MVISGSSVIVVNGRITRPLSRYFNVGLRKAKRAGADLLVLDVEGQPIFPSKGLSWTDVGQQIRAGKKVQASGATKARKASVKSEGSKTPSEPRKRATSSRSASKGVHSPTATSEVSAK
jgi:hypothetical protein